jgi:putative glycosyltransferase (TIGR04372 family)
MKLKDFKSVVQRKGASGLLQAVNNRFLRAMHWGLACPLFGLHVALFLLALPVRRISIGIFPTERIGHLALNPDLYLRRRRLASGNGIGAPGGAAFFVAGKPANEQLLKMWKRELRVYRLPFLHAVLRTSQRMWEKSPFYQPMEMQSTEYDVFSREPAVMGFTPEEEDEGRRQLAGWGIDPERDWFVCIYARDAAYLKSAYPDAGDWSYHDNRNADIAALGPAVDEIIGRGGYVLRMGHHVAKPLVHASSRVIDYASRCRSDFMDIYLAAKCLFFLGTTGGIGDVATTFDRPRLGIDWVPFGNAPLAKRSLFIPKLIDNPATGEKYSFRRLLRDFSKRNDPKLWDGMAAFRQGYRYLDNTPEEILAATREMFDRLADRHETSREEEALQSAYRAAFPAEHWCSGIGTPIATEFLKTHRELLMVSA